MQTWKRLIAVVLGSLFLTAAASHAATIHACRKKVGGAVRIVGAKTVCADTETKLSWNSVGPQGPQGLPGNLALAGTECPRGRVLVGFDQDGQPKCVLDLSGFTCYSDIAGADFSGANLTGAFLAWDSCRNHKSALFTGANLSYATLPRDCGGMDLSNVVLANTRVNSDLRGANLTGADLAGADLTGALLGGATLTGVVWSGTTCPDGSNSGTNGTSPESCAGHLDIPWCGDGLCNGTENADTCSADCPAVCGDAICSPAETDAICDADCPPMCGDGFCGSGESIASCNVDCPPVCGDGVCSIGETPMNCAADCL